MPLARLYAARGARSLPSSTTAWRSCCRPTGCRARRPPPRCWPTPSPPGGICIVADYDCDGATACAVGLRGLRLLGATQLDYLVPDRVIDGYGLTPPIAERVARGAELLITVDNGIASVEGVARQGAPAGAGD